MKSSNLPINYFNLSLSLDIDDVNKALGELHDDLELKVPTREFKEALSE